ncbi:MAG: glycosyltransferase family 2 protein [Chloroflexi bacterium]|nr:glycosyltransferase family 2 protein [Chloroflexota bacterium]
MDGMRVSVVVPAYNEEGNIGRVIESAGRAFAEQGLAGEVIVVDDGSSDGTFGEAIAAAEGRPWVRVVRHRRNRGLTEAMETGFRQARGDVVMLLPGDMESHPEEDIPKLLAKMDEGYDVVAGWRQGRHDGKVFASRIYNTVSRWLFGLQAHDMNWIKAFRRPVVEELLPLRSDWHRFVLMIAASKGFRIGETPVNFYPRRQGRSKYGFWRIPVSLLDVLVVKFLLTFSRKPMLFFGSLGLTAVASGGVLYLYLLGLWLTLGKQQRPIFWFAGVLLLAGLILFLIGFVAELVVNQQDRLDDMDRQLRALAERQDRE